MKLLIYADNHFCETCSIVQKRGFKYTKRLENQLQTMSWLKELAETSSCDAIVCLGDFFDKSELTDQEITALKDITWSEIPTYFLVGNHESEEADLQFNTAKALESPSRIIITSPQKAVIDDCELCFLPYINEATRLPIAEYFGEKVTENRIIFSHNDLCGIQLGPIISKIGFGLDEIEQACDLFINGHLHNGQLITQKIINLGNITGKDFGENALVYQHSAMLLDTKTLKYELLENPYAFNFYKLEVLEPADLNKLSQLKNNSVVSIKCSDVLMTQLKTELAKYVDRIVESRIISVCTSQSADGEPNSTLSELTVDHLARFVEYCKAKIEASDILDAELSEVCK